MTFAIIPTLDFYECSMSILTYLILFAYSPPDPEQSQVRDTGRFANRTGMVTGVVRQIPFQPTIFAVCISDFISNT